jgi:hypothetical protein
MFINGDPQKIPQKSLTAEHLLLEFGIFVAFFLPANK